jgi:hypothetical protein
MSVNAAREFRFRANGLFAYVSPNLIPNDGVFLLALLTNQGDSLCEIRDNELVVPAAPFEVEQVGRALQVRSKGTDLLELELLPPTTLAINQYRFRTPEGEVFIGKRQLADPLSGTESDKSVLEFRHASGGVQTFVNCAFRADLGLHLCLKEGALVLQNQRS